MEEGASVGHGRCASWEAAASPLGAATCQKTEALPEQQGELESSRKKAVAANAVAAAAAEAVCGAEKGSL